MTTLMRIFKLFQFKRQCVLLLVQLFSGMCYASEESGSAYTSQGEMADLVRAAANLRESSNAEKAIPKLFESVIFAVGAKEDPMSANSDFDLIRETLYGTAVESIDDLINQTITHPSLNPINSVEMVQRLSKHAETYQRLYPTSYEKNIVFHEFENLVADAESTNGNISNGTSKVTENSRPTVNVTAPEPATEEPAEVVVTELIEKDVKQSLNWWLWLIGVLVVVGCFGLVLRRKS